MLRMIGPRHPRNRLALPSQRNCIPSCHAIASMRTKSQFDVCGTPSSTVGRVGAGSVESVQRLKAQYRRAARRRSIRQTYAVAPHIARCRRPSSCLDSEHVRPRPRIAPRRRRRRQDRDRARAGVRDADGGRSPLALPPALRAARRTHADLFAPGGGAGHDRRRGASRERTTDAEPQGIAAGGHHQRRSGRAVADVLQPVLASEGSPAGSTGRLRRQSGRVSRVEAARPSRLRALRRRGDGSPQRRSERESADPDLSGHEHDRELAAQEDHRPRPRRSRSRRGPASGSAAAHGRPARRAHRDRAHPSTRFRRPDRARAQHAAHARGVRAAGRAAPAATVRARAVGDAA